jgi:hypothetical protein
VDAVPCSNPHHAEVYATFKLTGSTYPGDEVVGTQSDSGCQSYLSVYSASATDDDALTLYYFAPTRESWRAGDRGVVCIASDEDHLRTGSIKG